MSADGMQSIYNQCGSDQKYTEHAKSLEIFFAENFLERVIQEKVQQGKDHEEMDEHIPGIVCGEGDENADKDFNASIDTYDGQLSTEVIHLCDGKDEAEGESHVHHVAKGVPEETRRYEKEECCKEGGPPIKSSEY